MPRLTPRSRPHSSHADQADLTDPTDSTDPADQPGASQGPGSRRPSGSPAGTSGTALVLGCYVLWGFFPLYFRLLSEAGSVEVIANRIVWTLVTCLLLSTLRRRWAPLRAVVTTPRLLGASAACGTLVSLNWLVYVYGVNTGRTADAALGYFINPLVTVALAALVLGERLRRAQVVAVGLAVAAVVLLVVLQGSLPWISLALALSFGLYGLVKKRVGSQVDALTGLMAETAVVSPVALAYLGWLAAHHGSALQGPHASPQLAVLLVVAGPVTAVPLLLFAAGTRRVALTVVGLSQYLAPIIQFLLAWALFHEDIPPARWVAMVLVWTAVAVFVTDIIRQVTHRPRAS